MITEGSEDEARSKCQEVSVQCTPSTSDVNVQFAGGNKTSCHSKGKKRGIMENIV